MAAEYASAAGRSGRPTCKRASLPNTRFVPSVANKGGGDLKVMTALLADLPEGASEIGNADKLAAKMADELKAAVHARAGCQFLRELPKTFLDDLATRCARPAHDHWTILASSGQHTSHY